MSQNDPANTFFLLVPSTEKPVATEELFEAENGIPGLLQITVPFSMLYKPEILLPTLCHELAHYVGEIHRLREERYKLFLKAVAIDIVNIFFKGTKEGFDSFVDFLAEDFLSETLQRSFAKTNPCDNCNKIMELPLLNIAIRIGEMVSLMRGCEAYSEPVKEYLLSSKNKNTKIIPVSPQFLNDCFNAFQRMLSEKRILFRETYADVCMLYFLDLSPEQYLIISLPNDSPINLTYLYQVYIALNVMGYSLGIIKTALENWGKVVNADKGDIEKACKELASINESINDTSTADNCLFVYITKCKESLSTSYKNRKKEYGYIKKMYNIAINSDTKYEDFLNVIDNSRKDFFERILQVD